MTISTTIAFALSLWVVPAENVILTGLGLIIAGMVTVPVTPLGFVFSIELTHPIQPVLSNGFLLMCAQIMSLIMSISISLIAKTSSLGALGTFTVLCAIASLAAFLMKEELRLNAASKD